MAEFMTTCSPEVTWLGDKLVPPESTVVCDPCSEDGKQLTASGYCVDCEENLCEVCYSHHRTPRPFRHHLLQDKVESPNKRVRRQLIASPAAKCCIHPGKDLVSYCQTHDQLCCENCVLIGHKVCKDVCRMEDMGTSIETNPEFKAFYDKLQSMNKEYKNKQEITNNRLEAIDKYYNDAMEKFKARLDGLKAKDVAKISFINSAYDSAGQQLTSWISEIEKCWKSQQCGQLFILMKMTHKQLDVIENNVQQLCTDNKILKYRFVECQNGRGNVLGKLESI